MAFLKVCIFLQLKMIGRTKNFLFRYLILFVLFLPSNYIILQIDLPVFFDWHRELE